MRPNRGLFSSQVTRSPFALGVLAVVMGMIWLVLTSSGAYVGLLLAGVALVALSTRGRWDSEKSGRNRSVLGIRPRR
jgi:hypothetical protein